MLVLSSSWLLQNSQNESNSSRENTIYKGTKIYRNMVLEVWECNPCREQTRFCNSYIHAIGIFCQNSYTENLISSTQYWDILNMGSIEKKNWVMSFPILKILTFLETIEASYYQDRKGWAETKTLGFVLSLLDLIAKPVLRWSVCMCSSLHLQLPSQTATHCLLSIFETLFRPFLCTQLKIRLPDTCLALSLMTVDDLH